jgi:indoleamine 2,3-dioxygenase
MSELLTGTEDEAWFYLVSVMVEAQGARSIPLMLDAIQAAASPDREAVIDALIELRHIIQHLGKLLERMYERCKPAVY